MRRPFHSRSRSFRTVLGMALLAWGMLASGALAAPLSASGAAGAEAMPMTHGQASAADCDGMPMQHTTPHSTPAMPTGQGDCCHGGCHCLSACSAVLAVPRSSLVGYPPHALLPILASAAPLTVPTAPPLRPPIA